jgi:hypothetical protein
VIVEHDETTGGIPCRQGAARAGGKAADVRPIPPGQGSDAGNEVTAANVVTVPLGLTCMMVVPVPCTLALSLKLLTRVSPATRSPTVSGTTAMP